MSVPRLPAGHRVEAVDYNRLLSGQINDGLVYYGETTGWKQPWNMPWGLVDDAGFTDPALTSGTTVLTVADRTVTPLVPNRRLLARWSMDGHYGSTVNDIFSLDITMDSTSIATNTYIQVETANNYIAPGVVERVFTTTTTSHRFRLLTVRAGGTGTYDARGWLRIYDVGPNGTAPTS